MKKILIILVMVLALTLSGCSKEKLDGVKCVADNSTCDINEEQELNQIIVIVKSRVDYYTFEEGYYYAYKFTVEDTTNIFEHNNRNWFYSDEKWEKDDVVIVTDDNDELHFINIGNLKYNELEEPNIYTECNMMQLAHDILVGGTQGYTFEIDQYGTMYELKDGVYTGDTFTNEDLLDEFCTIENGDE